MLKVELGNDETSVVSYRRTVTALQHYKGLAQSPWGMAMCLVWQSVQLGMVETGPFFC